MSPLYVHFARWYRLACCCFLRFPCFFSAEPIQIDLSKPGPAEIQRCADEVVLHLYKVSRALCTTVFEAVLRLYRGSFAACPRVFEIALHLYKVSGKRVQPESKRSRQSSGDLSCPGGGGGETSKLVVAMYR